MTQVVQHETFFVRYRPDKLRNRPQDVMNVDVAICLWIGNHRLYVQYSTAARTLAQVGGFSITGRIAACAY